MARRFAILSRVFLGMGLIGCSVGSWADHFFHGDKGVIEPESGILRPGHMSTNCLRLNLPYLNQSGNSPFTSSIPGYYPSDIRRAYDMIANVGYNAIAVVDAFDLSSSLTDFNTFSTQFSLPTETSSNVTASTNKVFQVVYQTGTKPGDAHASGWDMEEVLDIEWAHAMSPTAKIFLVEANSTNDSDLFAAVQVAAALPNVKEVSMSWGGGEFSGENTYDNTFAQNGVVYFCSSGDNSVQEYPSESPNVVSVGGTSLNVNGSGYQGETGWSGSGGGLSAYEPRPTFQNAVGSVVGSFRGDPDISAVADPYTGVAVYSSTAFAGYSDWQVVGGTSLACPVVAAITNARETIMNSFTTSTLTENLHIYGGLMGSFFRDITSGSTPNESCALGYDLVTGVGSPVGLLSSWSKFHEDGLANGYGYGLGAADIERWNYPTGGVVESSPSISVTDIVYTGSADSYLYATDGATGVLMWKYQTGGAIYSSPAVGYDTSVYVGSSDDYVYAFNGFTGALKWKFLTGGAVLSSPTIDCNGNVYVGSMDGKFYALSAATGTPLWSYPTGAGIESSGALSNGNIYFGSNDDNVYSLTSSGALNWSYPTSGAVESGPSIGINGNVYVTSMDGNVYALDASSGTKIWSYSTGSPIFSSPMAGFGGGVFVCSQNDKIYAFNGLTGATNWVYTAPAAINSSPALDGNWIVYFGCADGKLYAVRGTTGVELWTFATGGPVVSSPAVDSRQGELFFGSDDGHIYAVGTSIFAALTGSPNPVVGGSSSTASLQLARITSSLGLTVNLSSNSSVLTVPSTVNVAANANHATFTMNTSAVTSNQVVTVTASANGSVIQMPVTVAQPTFASLTDSPTSVTGGVSSTGTVTMRAAAGSGGDSVTLSSNNSAVSVPARVTVAVTKTSATFTASSVPVATTQVATITASFNGSSITTTLTVLPPALSSVSVSPSTVVGGTSTTGTVQLTGNAASAGVVVTLQSSSSSASVPASVTVTSGHSSATFTITTSAVSSTTSVTITAKNGTVSKTTTLTLNT